MNVYDEVKIEKHQLIELKGARRKRREHIIRQKCSSVEDVERLGEDS